MSKLTAAQLDEQAGCKNTLREWLTEAGEVWTRLDAGRGETDYVKVYVISAKRRIVSITYYVARAGGDFRSIDRGIARGGGGYSKTLDVAEDAYRAAGLEFSQDRHYNEFS